MLNRYSLKITFYGFIDIAAQDYRYNYIDALNMGPQRWIYRY